VAALLPCMWSYAEIGERLAAAGLPDHEGYAEWITLYASDEFGQLAEWCRELTDAAAAEVAGPGRLRMHAAFRASSEHELAFYESAWNS
jgi:thiaminase (transcriptional activator TenA)